MIGNHIAQRAGVLIIAAAVFGLMPALAATRPDLGETLKESSSRETPGRRNQRLRQGFLVAQLALAVVLLIGAGLLLTSLVRLEAVNAGFRAGHLLAAFVRSTELFASLPGPELAPQ